MIAPSLLPVLALIVLWVVIDMIADRSAAFAALGAMLLGTIVTGLFVAISDRPRAVAPGIMLKNILKMGIMAAKALDAHARPR